MKMSHRNAGVAGCTFTFKAVVVAPLASLYHRVLNSAYRIGRECKALVAL